MIDLPVPQFAQEVVFVQAQEVALMQVGGGTIPRRESELPLPHRRKGKADPAAGWNGQGKPTLERPDLPERDRLADCLAKAASNPDAAMVEAQVWLGEGRSAAQQVRANHCLGVLRANAGDFDASADAFAAAVAGIPAEQEVAAVPLMAMAGNAALAGGKADAALGWFDRALAVKGYADAPALGAIQIDRSRALVALGRTVDAAAALHEAHRLAPADAEGWLLSATLARRQGSLALAQRDIETAAGLDPRDPRIGLEAGVIAVLAGRDEAARKSWESVIAMDRDGDLARTAQGYLDQLGPVADTATPAAKGEKSGS